MINNYPVWLQKHCKLLPEVKISLSSWAEKFWKRAMLSKSTIYEMEQISILLRVFLKFKNHMQNMHELSKFKLKRIFKKKFKEGDGYFFFGWVGDGYLVTTQHCFWNSHLNFIRVYFLMSLYFHQPQGLAYSIDIWLNIKGNKGNPMKK